MFERAKYYIARTEDFHQAITSGVILKVLGVRESDTEPLYTTMLGKIVSVRKDAGNGFLITTETTKNGFLQIYLI